MTEAAVIVHCLLSFISANLSLNHYKWNYLNYGLLYSMHYQRRFCFSVGKINSIIALVVVFEHFNGYLCQCVVPVKLYVGLANQTSFY